MNTDESLNRAIDQVARELTSGAPAVGFAGRVHVRLERPSVLPRWRWQLAGAASAILIAVIVWLALPERVLGPTTFPRPRLADRVLPGQPEQPAASQIADRTEQAAHMPVRARSLPPNIRIEVDMESAPQIAAIAEPGDLLVPTIEIAELTVAPLEPEKESPR